MEKVAIKICVFIFSVIFISGAFAQDKTIPYEKTDKVALEALKNITKYQSIQNESIDLNVTKGIKIPLQEIKLGTSYIVYWIGLDQLKGYNKEGDPKAMLKGGDELLYSFNTSSINFSESRSSLTISDVKSELTISEIGDGQWKETSTGIGESIRIDRIENFVNEKRGIDKKSDTEPGKEVTRANETEFFLVKLLALNLELVGYYQDDTLMLAPLYDYPDLELVANTPMPASELFEKLQPIALDYKGFPEE